MAGIIIATTTGVKSLEPQVGLSRIKDFGLRARHLFMVPAGLHRMRLWPRQESRWQPLKRPFSVVPAFLGR
jgi:hypothetical protein